MPRIPKALCLTQPWFPLVFTVRSYGVFFFCHWNPELWGLLWGWDPLLLRGESSIVLCYTWVLDRLFCFFAPPTSLHVASSVYPVVLNDYSVVYLKFCGGCGRMWVLQFPTLPSSPAMCVYFQRLLHSEVPVIVCFFIWVMIPWVRFSLWKFIALFTFL